MSLFISKIRAPTSPRQRRSKSASAIEACIERLEARHLLTAFQPYPALPSFVFADEISTTPTKYSQAIQQNQQDQLWFLGVEGKTTDGVLYSLQMASDESQSNPATPDVPEARTIWLPFGISGFSVQQNGQFVAVARQEYRHSLVRFDVYGKLDLSFGDHGFVDLPVFRKSEVPLSMSVQADDRIVIAGNPGASATVLRFLPDGTPDPSFGQHGEVRDLFSVFSTREVLLSVMPDERIIIVAPRGGTSCCGGLRYSETRSETKINHQREVVVARLLSDGSFDPSFDLNGIAYPDYPGDIIGWPKGLATDAEGGVFFGNGGGQMIHLNADGSVDETFGDHGRWKPETSSGSANGMQVQFSDFIMQNDGSLLATQRVRDYTIGDPVSAYHDRFLVTRLRATAAPDSSASASLSETATTASPPGSSYMEAQASATASQQSSNSHSSSPQVVSSTGGGSAGLTFLNGWVEKSDLQRQVENRDGTTNTATASVPDKHSLKEERDAANDAHPLEGNVDSFWELLGRQLIDGESGEGSPELSQLFSGIDAVA
jgi:uncharacterized delta-60 repeat protein